MQISLDSISTCLFWLVSNPVMPVVAGGAALGSVLVRDGFKARMWFRCTLASAAFALVGFAAGGGSFPAPPILCEGNVLHGGVELMAACLLAVASFLALMCACGLRSRRLTACAVVMACAACFTILRLNP